MQGAHDTSVAQDKPLNRFVGEWIGDVTVTECGNTSRYIQTSTFAWVLGGHFLHEVGGYGDISFHGFWNYDLSQGYRTWYFINPGPIAATSSFAWDANSLTFKGHAELENGMRMVITDQFQSADEYEWRMLVMDAGDTVFSETFVRQRRAR